MSQISSWYNNQYSGPFRSTRLRAPSLVPAPRVAVNQQTLVVDGRNGANGSGAGAAGASGKEGEATKRRETIFGPDVGEDDEPGWTQPEEGVKVGVETVKKWVERAKAEEGLHQTTTLQALVNLKRPTLQLLQLDRDPAADPRAAIRRDLASIPAGATLSSDATTGAKHFRAASDASFALDDINPAMRHLSMSSALSSQTIPTPPMHILKFAYDATSPAVRITLTIHPTPSVVPPLEGKESIHEEAEAIKTVYSGIHTGGFNQSFTLPHSAAMDLSSAVAPLPTTLGQIDEEDKKDAAYLPRGAQSEDTTRTSYERGLSNMSTTLATVPEVGSGEDYSAGTNGVSGRVRNLFGRRRRENDVEQGNIELEERNANTDGEKKEGDEEQKEEKGMRVLIRIEGVGAEGEPLSRKNAQLTHMLISGMWVTDNSASTATVDGQPGAAVPGKRVWVVKVVRREAIIGAHTFLLKEIYGLSTAASSAPSATYPPSGEADPYASTPNECIVCLTSPRDVVLLPCRHLVVCRECAVGMVEFGAGGKVARREDTTAEEGNAETGAAATGGETGPGTAPGPNAAAAATAGTTATGRERRKKKAKGWYCPVCRQPYTSLLRLALPETAPTSGHEDGDAHEHAYDESGLFRTKSRGAASIRSTRTGRQSLYLHRVGSRATLPDGAERMLEALRPEGARDGDDDSDDEVEDAVGGSGTRRELDQERPQFVLGDEIDTDGKTNKEEDKKKAEVDHRETVNSVHEESFVVDHEEAGAEGSRRSLDGKRGWKEV